MKVSKLLIGAFASLTILLASCGGDTKTAKDGHVHTAGDGHDHATEQVEKPAEKTTAKKQK